MSNRTGKPKLPTAQVQAEIYLLACCYQLSEAAENPDVVSLQPFEFVVPEHAIILRGLVACRLAGLSPNALPVWLMDSGEYERVRLALLQVTKIIVSGSDAAWCACRIHDYWDRCAFVRLADEIRDAVANREKPDAIDAMIQARLEIRRTKPIEWRRYGCQQ